MIVNDNHNPNAEEINQQDMPLGFSFTLATNRDAMANFANLNNAEKRQVIEAARMVQSKHEMQSFVDSIAKLSFR